MICSLLFLQFLSNKSGLLPLSDLFLTILLSALDRVVHEVMEVELVIRRVTNLSFVLDEGLTEAFDLIIFLIFQVVPSLFSLLVLLLTHNIRNVLQPQLG